MTDIPNQSRILVYGAGAVGSLMGGALSSAGRDVTFFGRERSMAPIRDQGLEVRLHRDRHRIWPSVISDEAVLRQQESGFDVVILTVRCYDVAGAMDLVRSAVRDGGALVSMQNGIGTEDLIAGELPDARLVAGSLTLSAEAPEPAVVVSSSRTGGVCFAPATPDAPVAAIAAMFQEAGVAASTVSDYRSMKWSKLLLNQMGNGLPAILGWTPGCVYRHDDIFRIEHAMLRETLRVIRAAGARLIALPGFPVPLLSWVLRTPPWLARRILLRRVEGGRGEKQPSLALDLRAGRTLSEARWLYGAVADEGERYGEPAPINRRIHRLLEGVAANHELRAAFLNNPSLLIRNVIAAFEEPT